MNSIKFSESIDIHATPESIFDYTQDYSKRLDWDTFLTKAVLINNAIRADKGVRAWCVNKYGMGMETEYVSFRRPYVTAVKMTIGPYMFREFAASWNFKESAIGVTRVTFLYSFALNFPFNLTGFIIKRILQSNVQQRLIDLRNEF